MPAGRPRTLTAAIQPTATCGAPVATTWPLPLRTVTVAWRSYPVGLSVAVRVPAPTVTVKTSVSLTASDPVAVEVPATAVAAPTVLPWSSGATVTCSRMRARSSSTLVARVLALGPLGDRRVVADPHDRCPVAVPAVVGGGRALAVVTEAEGVARLVATPLPRPP